MTVMAPRVRIATWNCFGSITSLQGLLLARPRFPERLVSPALPRALAAFDVVCVQENFLPFVTTALEEVAHEARMRLWYDRDLPGIAERSVFGGGLAILSRRAPRSVTFTTFEGRSHGFDAYACKGFAVAEFDSPGGRYRVVNTHLQADDPVFGVGDARAVRAAQFEALLAALDPRVPTVLAGDLNVPYGSDEYAATVAPALDRAGLRDHGAGLPLVTFDPVTNDLLRAVGPTEVPARLDYVLSLGSDALRWTERAAPRLVLAEPLDEPLDGGRGRMFASDHYGLGVTLELSPQIEARPGPRASPVLASPGEAPAAASVC